MDTAVKVFHIVQAVVVITGLVWVLTGAIDFFGGRNNNDSMRQEKRIKFNGKWWSNRNYWRGCMSSHYFSSSSY